MDYHPTADQHLLDGEQTAAMVQAFQDIAKEHSIEDVLIYLALASPPAIPQPVNAIWREVSSLREDGLLAADRKASPRAQHRLQTRITSHLQDSLLD